MKRKKLHKVDEQLLYSAATGRGLVQIKSAEELQKLALQAKVRYDQFGAAIERMMTVERALFVKNLRMTQQCTWRSVAAYCHAEWQADEAWTPPSNQLAGMQLCRIAGEILHEIID